MNLYEINKELLDLSERMDEFVDNAGEISQEFFDKLEEAENRLTDKADNIIGFYQSKIRYAEMKEAEAERFLESARRDRKSAENMKKYALNVMERFGKDSLDGTIGQLKITRSTATVIEDETKLPEKFRKVEQIPATERITYPKADIKKAIEAGEEVPGARLEFRKDVKIK